MKRALPIMSAILSGIVFSANVKALPITPYSDTSSSHPNPKRSPASAEIARGLQAIANNQLQQAETAFRNAAALDPRSPSPLLGLAQVAELRKQANQAETYLQQAQQLAPNVAEVATAKGRYYLSHGKVELAEASFKKAVELAPKAIPPHLELADFYLNQANQPEKAANAYRATLAVKPDTAAAQYGLAMALSVANRRDQAIPEFERAASLLPRDPMPLISLGRLYITLGDTDRALATIDRALKINPKFVPAHVDRGDILLSRNDVKNAVSEYQTAASSEPRNSAIQVKLGNALLVQKRFNDAEDAFQKAIAGDKKIADAYNNLAWLQTTKKSDLGQALTWAQQAVQMEPNASGYRDTLGWVYYTRGEYEPATIELEKAAVLNPKDAAIQYHLGVTRAAQNRREEAAGALRKALQIDPNFESAADARARLAKLASR